MKVSYALLLCVIAAVSASTAQPDSHMGGMDMGNMPMPPSTPSTPSTPSGSPSQGGPAPCPEESKTPSTPAPTPNPTPAPTPSADSDKGGKTPTPAYGNTPNPPSGNSLTQDQCPEVKVIDASDPEYAKAPFCEDVVPPSCASKYNSTTPAKAPDAGAPTTPSTPSNTPPAYGNGGGKPSTDGKQGTTSENDATKLASGLLSVGAVLSSIFLM